MDQNYVLKISALAFSALSFIFMIVGLTGSKLQTVSIQGYEVEYSARGEAKGAGLTIDLLDPDLDCYEDTCVARGMALGGIALLSLGLLLWFPECLVGAPALPFAFPPALAHSRLGAQASPLLSVICCHLHRFAHWLLLVGHWMASRIWSQQTST